MNGYAGRILKVDLSTGTFTTIDSSQYLPEYMGGTALAYKIIWDQMKTFPADEWSVDAPLVFATGPAAGSGVLGTGRTNVSGFAPQSYPKAWLATSSFGGDFGPKMKFAGWDAIYITGKLTSPAYLYVDENGGKLISGTDAWGMTNYQAQIYISQKHGKDVAIATIGPAGENRVRWAAIESNTENGAGQGGFGAVMGDKKLKAVAIKPGSKQVQVAKPDDLLAQMMIINKEMSPTTQTSGTLASDAGRYTTRVASCPWSGCTTSTNCGARIYNNVPQKYTGTGTVSGTEFCAPGAPTNLMVSISSEVRTEIRRLEGTLGLNHWEPQFGMNFFIDLEFRLGKLTKLMGKTIPKSSTGAAQLTPEDVIAWWTAVAYRQGEGDAWADGTTRAANALGLGDEVWKTHKHGYGPHWDGRYMQYVRSPVWINSALTWAIHGRDPHNHEHDIPERYTTFVQEWGRTTSMWGTPALPYAQMCDLGRQLYGEFFPQGQYFLEGWDAATAKYQYTDKEYVTLVHNYRGMIKDSVPVCDRLFPLLYDTASSPPKVGHFSAETDIFNAITGTTWTLKDMHKSADKALNIQRAIMLMQGRTRATDESVIPYFSEQKDNWPNDVGPQTLDPVKFKDLLSRYYAAKGWDSQGRPKRAILESLGLKDVADKLASLNLLGT